jgi:hypothetical protein
LATGPWDAFQIASASFQIHCAQLNAAREKSHENLAHAEPILLGTPSSKTMDEQEVEHTETSVQVYDDMTDVRFLVCSEATYPVRFLSLCLLAPLILVCMLLECVCVCLVKEFLVTRFLQ